MKATGQREINNIVKSMGDFSRGGALLRRGKKYIDLLEIMRQSYAYFPREFLDILSSLHDYHDVLAESKDNILNIIQKHITYGENVPWTVKMMCNE